MYKELLARSRRRRMLPPPEIRRMLREKAGITQEEIAGALGVSRPAISRWESGARTPRGERLLDYIELLDQLMKATRWT